MATLKDLAHGALKHLYIGVGGDPVAAEASSEALTVLRDVLARLPEYGGGRKLVDESIKLSVTAKPDARLICTVTGLTITLPPDPADGTRVSAVPLSGSASVISVDRRLEGATSSLSISADTAWTYRADQADWVKTTTLADNANSPFSDDSDSAIKYITAMELADVLSVEITAALASKIEDAKSFLRAKYYRPREEDWFKSVPYSVQGPNRLRGYR